MDGHFRTRRAQAGRRRAGRRLRLLLATLLPLVSSTASAQEVSSEAWFELGVGSDAASLEANHFPVGNPRAEKEGSASSFPLDVTVLDEPSEVLLWAYANESGRVRASGLAKLESTGSFGSVRLTWARTFVKNAASDTARFTLNPSFLNLSHAGASLMRLYQARPRAVLEMTVSVYDGANELDGEFAGERFAHQARLEFTGFPPITRPVLDWEATRLNQEFVHIYDQESGLEVGDKRVRSLIYEDPSEAFYEVGPYTGHLDLAEVEVGARYLVVYSLLIEVTNIEGEVFSAGYLGDPLDVDSGFVFETDSTPADDQESSPSSASFASSLCTVDEGRFAVTPNATLATDRQTGLTWQRCPVGMVLDTGGTVSEPGDDRCMATGDTRVDWQAALQGSLADATGGFPDWRVPDVKELESLVQLRCPALAIDPLAFPRTARRQFWSSTPSPLDGARAEAVSFARGDVVSREKVALLDVRRVRDSGQAPVLPLPAVSVGRPKPVTEGHLGTRVLEFPVRLDRPVATAVTVGYQTRDASATAGSDYTPTSGTVTLAAGTTAAVVPVTVHGDLVGESNEELRLVLGAVSPNARLLQASAHGQILDDEPVATLLPTDAAEPATGTGDLVFTVVLDRPAAGPVTLDYETLAGTAAEGADFLAKAGQLTIATGDRYATIVVPILADALLEGDEYVLLALRQPTGASVPTLAGPARGYILDEDDVPPLSRLDDTAMDTCARDGGLFGAFGSCPQLGFPGQDGDFGRDATQNDDADGLAGFVFTKLDGSGAALADQAASYLAMPWDCVRDEHTGLFWEVKTDDGGLRDKDWTYTWYSSTGIHDGGSAGTPSSGVCVDTSSCDTEKYVAAVNAAGACGFHDWRLPSREELMSIAMQPLSSSQPPYDVRYFPNTRGALAAYLTSTPRAKSPPGSGLDTGLVWAIGDRGVPTERHKNVAGQVRLVRGTP